MCVRRQRGAVVRVLGCLHKPSIHRAGVCALRLTRLGREVWAVPMRPDGRVGSSAFVCFRWAMLLRWAVWDCIIRLRRCAASPNPTDGPPIHAPNLGRCRMRGWTRRHGCACVARAFVRTEGFVRLSRVKERISDKQTNKQSVPCCLFVPAPGRGKSPNTWAGASRSHT